MRALRNMDNKISYEINHDTDLNIKRKPFSQKNLFKIVRALFTKIPSQKKGKITVADRICLAVFVYIALYKLI